MKQGLRSPLYGLINPFGRTQGRGGVAPILTLIADNLDQDPPTYSLNSSAAGTLRWDFHSSATPPAAGAGDIGTGTESVVAGDNTLSIDLSAFPGTGFLHFRIGGSNILTSQEITVVAFTPADLFGIGDVGYFYDFTTGNVFTDTARTTPASVTDAVAGVTDLSGVGNHLTQSTSGSRPLLGDASGLLHLVFDGTDDRMDTSVDMTGKNACTVWAVISKDVDPAATGIILSNSLNGGEIGIWGPTASGDARYSLRAKPDNTFDRHALSSSIAAPDLCYLVGSIVMDGAANPSTVLRRNGTQVGTSSAAGLWATLGSQTHRVGNNQFNNADFSGKIFALGFISRALTSQERSDLETWCAARGGI